MTPSIELAIPAPSKPADFKAMARMICAQCEMVAPDPDGLVEFCAGAYKVRCVRTREACYALAAKLDKGAPTYYGSNGHRGYAGMPDLWRREHQRIAPYNWQSTRNITERERAAMLKRYQSEDIKLATQLEYAPNEH